MTTDAPMTTTQLDPVAVLLVFGLGAALAAAVAITLSIRRRDFLPVAACVGALIGALNEPIYDLLGKIVYASDNLVAYTAFDRRIPVFLVVGYLPWVGLLPVLYAGWMARGVPRRRLHAFAFVSFLSVVVIEMIGTSFDVWTYYGAAPLKYLGVAPQMAPMPVLGGMLLYAAGTRLRGWCRLAVGVIPTMALPATYAATGWPLYVALHADVPRVVEYLAGVATLGLCATLVIASTRMAERWRSAEQAEPGRARSPHPPAQHGADTREAPEAALPGWPAH